MSAIAIKIESVKKRYFLGKYSGDSLRERLTVLFSKSKSSKQEFWALNDVSFEVPKGKVIGIIGKNGAGKSTLLKILSRITKPTDGTVRMEGRVASLLEVGTGFHPELTGRENIFLNGAILGMKRDEVRSSFDEIVKFAGVEAFLDTPVKHYSSGMYVRLAFAVAAHLNSEILIIDEVLAVGDSEFQKKCLDRMQSVAGQGRTVLFVSHNMHAVQSLCDEVVYLEKGTVKAIGPPSEIVDAYLSENTKFGDNIEWAPEQAPGNENARLLKVGIKKAGKELYLGDPFSIEFVFLNHFPGTHQFDVTFHLTNQQGILIFAASTVYLKKEFPTSSGSLYHAFCQIPENLLNEGIYTVSKVIFNRQRGDVVLDCRDIFSFEIKLNPESIFGYRGRNEGVLRPVFNWEVEINEV